MRSSGYTLLNINECNYSHFNQQTQQQPHRYKEVRKTTNTTQYHIYRLTHNSSSIISSRNGRSRASISSNSQQNQKNHTQFIAASHSQVWAPKLPEQKQIAIKTETIESRENKKISQPKNRMLIRLVRDCWPCDIYINILCIVHRILIKHWVIGLFCAHDNLEPNLPDYTHQ